MVKNTGNIKKKTLYLAIMGTMSAISVLLVYFIRFPIFPAVSFLEYDPADIVIYFCTFLFGIPTGLVITVLVSVIQGITVSAQSGFVGIIMHIFATSGFVLSAGLTKKLLLKGKISKAKSGETVAMAISVVIGTLITAILMFVWNMLVTPSYMGCTIEAVMALMPFILLFNIIKAGINGTISVLLTLPVKRYLKGKL